MRTATLELTVLPPDGPLDDLAEIAAFVNNPAAAELIDPHGRRFVLPEEVFQVLAVVVSAMANGQAVTIAPHNQTLTTQEAADLLGVSRPTLVRLLDNGKMPYHQPGRHRRILLRDLLAYAEQRRHERHAGLDELVAVSEEAGLYEATAKPRPTR